MRKTNNSIIVKTIFDLADPEKDLEDPYWGPRLTENCWSTVIQNHRNHYSSSYASTFTISLSILNTCEILREEESLGWRGIKWKVVAVNLLQRSSFQSVWVWGMGYFSFKQNQGGKISAGTSCKDVRTFGKTSQGIACQPLHRKRNTSQPLPLWFTPRGVSEEESGVLRLRQISATCSLIKGLVGWTSTAQTLNPDKNSAP